MVVSHAHDLRKPSGGRKRRLRDKRKFESGSLPTDTKISPKESKETVHVRGTKVKNRLRYTSKANVLDTSTKQFKVCKILTERENPANREFARRNILTKGAIIETELGLAKITSRPGQHGVVNAVLLKK